MVQDQPLVPRKQEETKLILNRLRRVEGQIRGIQQMVEEDRYCTDILVQISAANSALKKVGLQVLEHHTAHCVVKATEEGENQKVMDDLISAIRQFSKS
ncbi:metal-sensing transcriptional repressor [Listeria ilorinensis]|uniref:metal-sensing transcriptional repressor n=1 Tax=Listeria ilorinensis TaxID=2867439 RepID=UPI001EF3D9EF|nr:metal-sensing transcriptional repressor [Listeria ilorinensis]